MTRLLLSAILIVMVAIMMSMETAAIASEFSLPTEGWFVNTRKEDCGADIEFTRAPDSSNALKMKFRGSTSAIVSCRSLGEQAKSWPESFGGLGCYIWNDGKLTFLRVQFRNRDLVGYTAHITLDHKGWKYITKASLFTPKQNRGKKFVPRDTESVLIYIGKRYDSQVAIGAIHWEPAGIEMVGRPSIVGTAHPVENPPKIDGKLDDEVWKNADPLILSYRAHSQDKPTKVNRAWVIYDDKKIYVAAECPYPKGTKLKAERTEHDSDIWQEEDVELFLNPSLDIRKYYQFLCNPLNTHTEYARIFDQVADRILFRADWNGKWESGVCRYEGRWTVEIAVPWKTIDLDGPPPLAEFQFMRGDRTGEKDEYPVWSPVRRRPWEGLGIMEFQERKPGSVRIEGVRLKSVEPGKLWLDGRVYRTDSQGKEASNPLGDMVLHASLAGPYMKPHKWTKEVTYPAAEGRLDWELKYDAPVSGNHRIIVRVEPKDGSRLAWGSRAFPFHMVQPSKVGFDDIVLLPEPKELEWKQGGFTLRPDDRILLARDATSRTKKTAVYLSQRLYDHFGHKPGVDTGGKKRRIILSVDANAVQEKTEQNSHEAYLLEITPSEIKITGAAEAGLYYGVVTLMQIARATKEPAAPIRSASISDWPSVKWRLYEEQDFRCGLAPSPESDTGYNLERYKRFIERHVAGCKLNMMVLGFIDSFEWKSHPEMHRKNAWTAEALREVSDLARDHFIEVVPSMQWGSHSLFFIKRRPELAQPGFKEHQMDVTNPLVYELFRDMSRDLIEACGQPVRFFHIMSDEWWHVPEGKPEPTYKGKTRQELLLGYLTRIHAILKEHGVRMTMFNDMLDAAHNGGPPWNTHKIAKKLPRDIVVAAWSGHAEPFHTMGFEWWIMQNGYRTPNKEDASRLTGFGTFGYGFEHSMFTLVSDERYLTYGYPAFIRSAEYGWNKTEKVTLPLPEWRLQYMPNLMGTFSAQSNPHAGKSLTPIDIELNLSEKVMVGNIPMKVGKTLISKKTPRQIGLASSTRASSILVLHGVQIPDKDARLRLRQRVRKNCYIHGVPVGCYQLIYEDGTETKFKIRLGTQINDMSAQASCRYLLDGRAAYPLPEDKNQALVQLELVNPCPGKVIKSIELTSLLPDAPIYLGGITLRGVRKDR